MIGMVPEAAEESTEASPRVLRSRPAGVADPVPGDLRTASAARTCRAGFLSHPERGAERGSRRAGIAGRL